MTFITASDNRIKLSSLVAKKVIVLKETVRGLWEAGEQRGEATKGLCR